MVLLHVTGGQLSPHASPLESAMPELVLPGTMSESSAPMLHSLGNTGKALASLLSASVLLSLWANDKQLVGWPWLRHQL